MKGGGGGGGGGNDAKRSHRHTHTRARRPRTRSCATLTVDRMENAPTRPRFTRVADGRRLFVLSRISSAAAVGGVCVFRVFVPVSVRVRVCLSMRACF